MKPVTDPSILAQLNATLPQEQQNDSTDIDKLKPVTDPKILAQLNATLSPKNLQPQSTIDKIANSAPVNALLGAGDAVANTERGLVDLWSRVAAGPKLDYQPIKTGDGLPYTLGNVGTQIGTFLGGGSLLNSGRLAAESAPYIGKLAQSLGGDGLSGIGRRALGSGLYGAIQNPNDQGKGAGETAALSIALDSLLGGASKLLPSNLLKGNLNKEELLKNLEVSRGTNTPLGDVVGSPGAKKWYENLAAKIPGSGSDITSANITNQIKGQGQDILNQLTQGEDTNGLKVTIRDALNKSYDDAMKLKRQHYKGLDDLAESYGLKIDTPTFENSAKEILDTVKESPRLMEEMDSSLLKKIEKYANPYNAEKIKSTNIFKGLLNDKARESFINGKDYEGEIYRNLKNSLEEDVRNSFESTGDPELQGKYKEAQNFYRTHIVPYEEPEVEKFIKKGGDSDMILSTFIKGGKNDRANLLDKLMSKIPEDQKSLVPAAYLSSVSKGGDLNPLAMRTLYNSLGDKQKQTLFSPDMKEKMDNFSRLVGMNTSSLSRMANNQNGQMAIQGIISGLMASAGAATGGIGGAAIGSMIGPLATSLGAKGVNKYMTSPSVREKLVNSMIHGNQGLRGKLGIGNGKYKETLKAALASYLNQQ